ncbi:MAG: M3 family metallopeptidase [Oscillospiraceae bacterium]|jgi:hypothetical protein|nr:M3 family metallopeptidase [Oscillospiraceae bacterium]
MKKTTWIVGIVVLLVAAMMLQGCSLLSLLMAGDEEFAYLGYARDYAPRLDYASFVDMEYTHMDVAALSADFEEVGQMALAEESPEDVSAAFQAAFDDYLLFYTMLNIAYVRYTIDLNDSYYEAESLYCEEQSDVLEQALENCYIDLASSSISGDLEDLYFGAGFFDGYDESYEGTYSNDRVVELFQRESQLLSEYYALQNEASVTYNGEEVLLYEAAADPNISYEAYNELLALYYEKYTPLAGEVFVQLLQVRSELAEEMGYDSYAQLAYDMYYDRRYTPDQALAYAQELQEVLLPIYGESGESPYLPSMSGERVMELLQEVSETFGGEIAQANRFMREFSLYDISSSSSKKPGSYTLYLESYESPFLYVSPEGTLSDLLVVTHEFGHFAEGYMTFNTVSSADVAEVFSQSLEYLMLDVVDLPASQIRQLSRAKMIESLETFIFQSCYYEFEAKVYELEDPTVESVTALYSEVMAEVCALDPDYELFYTSGWIDIEHVFSMPYYVISYCVSNDAALQVYALEHESAGSGLEAYYTLLEHAPNNTLLDMLSDSGLDSPFKAGRAQELAEFFAEVLP